MMTAWRRRAAPIPLLSMSNANPARKRSWTIGEKTPVGDKKEKREKYDFERMKAAATHQDPLVRKAAFIEYFERFSEFPSFFFDNEQEIDARLAATIDDLANDKDSSKALLEGVTALLNRLPS